MACPHMHSLVNNDIIVNFYIRGRVTLIVTLLPILPSLRIITSETAFPTFFIIAINVVQKHYFLSLF